MAGSSWEARRVSHLEKPGSGEKEIRWKNGYDRNRANTDTPGSMTPDRRQRPSLPSCGTEQAGKCGHDEPAGDLNIRC